jgi:hypothetical protein
LIFLERVAIDVDDEKVILIEECLRIRFPIAEPDWQAQWRCVVDSINQIGRQYAYEDSVRDRFRAQNAREEAND